MTNEQMIQQYLSSLAVTLHAMPPGDRQEILTEIEAHIHDSIADRGVPVAQVLQRLGSPQELAAQYLDLQMLRRARNSYSPLALLRAVLRIGAQSLTGILVFCCAIAGYLGGTLLIITSLLKPLFPDNIGLWHLEHRPITAGFPRQIPGSPMHEVLGWWYIPAALLTGVVFLIGTTLLIRSFLRLSRYVQKRFLPRIPAAAHACMLLISLACLLPSSL